MTHTRSRLRAVLFDIDGTLVDSNERHVDVWLEVLGQAGFPQHRQDVTRQIGKGGDLLVPTLVPGADDALVERVSERHGALFKERHLHRVRPLPGARDILARVRDSGRTVVLASSASRAELEHYIDLLDAADIVSAGTSIDDVETSKPAPDIFAAALAKAGVTAAEAIVVGDTTYDVTAAFGAGIATVGVNSGPFDRSALERAGAIAVYADVAALLAGFDRSPLA